MPRFRMPPYKISAIDARHCLNVEGVSHLTKEMAVVIFVPPDAPITKRATPSLSKNIDGAVEDWGRFPGSIMFDSEGSKP